MFYGNGERIIPTLAEAGVECDQRLLDALALAHANEPAPFFDGHVLHALVRLGANVSRDIDFDVVPYGATVGGFPAWPLKNNSGNRSAPNEITCDDPYSLAAVLNTAVEIRREQTTLGTDDFVEALVSHMQDPARRIFRLRSEELIAAAVGATPGRDLIQHPRVMRLLGRLRDRETSANDYQLVMAISSDGRLAIRLASVLDDYVQRGDADILVPSRVLVTHSRTFGSFVQEEIDELSELINNPNTRESQLQTFFERHPHFFRRWDHREIYPHVYLTRESGGDGPLIPDFILTNAAAQEAFILELKLPSARLIRNSNNRRRFADAILEARAQLLEYSDWFENHHHREILKARVGMAIYRPHLAVVIGRAAEFRDELDRAKLRSRTPDIDIVTYDDILEAARRRMLIMQTR